MNKRFEYEAIFRINIGQAIQDVGDLIKRINDHLATDGYDERISCHAELFKIDVSVTRQLTDQEEYQMKRLLEAEMIKRMPEHEIHLSKFCRKSGNAQQSVS